MDQQEDTLDFQALRAKFQDEDILLKQPKRKPALPDKPQVVPPPQSPPHYLPAGARPSLLTSISQSMEAKSSKMAPRVVFKDEKKESRRPLIQTNAKKDKSEGLKLKVGKDKTKTSKLKLETDSLNPKEKKENGKKGSTAELVQATPPPKATTLKKKGFLGFRRSVKKDSFDVQCDPILDAPSLDVSGPAPLIPVPSEFVDSPTQPEISSPYPDSPTTMELTPPFVLPASPDFTPPPAFIPDYPAPFVPAPQSQTPAEIETPAQSVSRPPKPAETPPNPPLRHAASGPNAAATAPSPPLPEPEVGAEAGMEAVNIDALEKPPSAEASPISEHPISALSALERAEDMNTVKRTPADQRIFNALDKARKKASSPLTNQSTSYSITPPPEEFPPAQSPDFSLLDLPPIDYEDRAGKGLPPKPGQVNGIDHRQASPGLEGISEEGADLPELLVVPPPPHRKLLPDTEPLDEPVGPPSVILSEVIPHSPVEPNEIHDPIDFSKMDSRGVPEVDDASPAARPPEMPLLKWGNGEYAPPDNVDGHNPPEFYSNGITAPGAEVQGAPALGDEYHPRALARLEGAEAANGIHVSQEYDYERISTSATKKKVKADVGKKRKGPPKNPYAEAAQETNEQKSKSGRFAKSEKKAAAEGPDEKELKMKKKEKQRLEREKKELKEKQEREKKEHREREKKENEIKKKFKISGQEDAMYQATVTVTTKGRKNDLQVNSGDVISIIRTTNCPQGKWLARDSSNNYGYVAVDHVELDIKEMLELGKRAAITRQASSNVVEGEVTSTGSRASNHYPLSTGSFTDDSEEWTGDEEETLSPAAEMADPFAPAGHTRTVSMPDMGNKDLSIIHQHSHSDLNADSSHMQARQEALQKLATFFHSPKPVEPASSHHEPERSPVLMKEEEAETVHLPETHHVEFDPNMIILPPPELYADLFTE